jgi:hypothetical protein
VGVVELAAGHVYPALQLLHTVAPASENLPGVHRTAVPLQDPAAGHAYPALQLVHTCAPATAKVPAGHIAVAGRVELEPTGHA